MTSSDKRKITKGDIEFLSSLQDEMNTQPTLCQADPRFWVIRSNEYVTALPGEYIDLVTFVDENGYFGMTFEDACDLAVKSARDFGGDEYLEGYLDKLGLYLSDKGNLIAYDDAECPRCKLIESYAEVRGSSAVHFMTLKTIISPNTLFLTKREAEEHIEKFGYNYLNPYAYAMTASRSPQVERLYDILHHVDFAALACGDENA